MIKSNLWFTTLVTCAGLACYVGCGGASAPANPTPQTPAVISVSISASSTALGTGQSSSLTATVSNDSKNAGVTWTLAAGAPGTLTTVDTLHATYAAGTVTQAGSAVVTATSVTDPTKSASVTVQLSLILTVNVTQTATDIGSNQTVSLVASVANDPKSAGVTWTLSSGAAGTLATVDTLHATYTSPAAISTASSITVTATSVTDATKTYVSTINLHPVSVTMGTPTAAAVGPLQTSQLSATLGYDPQGVTWTASAGTVTALNACPNGACAAIYSAPPDIAAASTATVTATSVSDPTKTASATVNLNAGSSWEDLVAFENGFQLGVTKPYKDLSRGNGVYQPDRMIFHEVALGNDGKPINTEIWRLDNDGPTPTLDSNNDGPPSWYIPGILNRTPWNENGTYFDLYSTACTLEVFCADPTAGKGGDEHNYLYDAAGDLVQTVVPTDSSNAIANPTTLASGEYLAWDKFNPNIFYVVTSTSTSYNDGQPHQALYAVDISKGLATTKIVDLPTTNPSNPAGQTSIPKIIQSYLSEDDVVMIQDENASASTGGAPTYIPYIYMVDVNPNRPATYGTIINEFPIDFSASLTNGLPSPNCPVGLNCPTHDPTQEYHFHDIFFQRDAADHFIFNYGPKGDVGEALFWVAPENGTASQVTALYPNLNTPYMSHPALNFNGSLIAYSGYDTVADQIAGLNAGAGNWVWSFSANGGLGATVGNMGAQGAGHQGWDGYDPSYIVFDAYTSLPDASGNETWSELTDNPSDPDGTHQRILVDALPRNPTLVADAQEVSVINGPSQSPDGTKMMFTLPESWSISQQVQFSAYIAVDHRPMPPALTATAAGSSVTLTWTPYLSHREVVGYHVYRSTDGVSFTELTDPTLNTAAFGSINATQFTDNTGLAGQTYYYAVTAQEYSGLESNQLSNIEQVSTGGAVTQFAAQGTTGWDTTAPQPPTNLQATNLGKGEWKLTWTASTSPNVRYYNIYYSGGGVPAVTDPVSAQHYLIDSPAATETSYIYWEANPNDVPVFGMVAVDRQDQFSTAACVQTANPGASCQ